MRIKHPKNWLQKKSKNILEEVREPSILSLIPESFKLNFWEEEKLKDVSTYTLFTNFNLKAIPESINQTMIHWKNNLWSIEVLEYIPTSRELLNLQVKNKRCITLITNSKQIDTLILKVRDPLSFALHDLMHAEQFFSQIESQKGQLGFYHLIERVYDSAYVQDNFKLDSNFKNEFEYVASDMNAYVIHLFKCLKSSFSRINKEDDFEKILNSWDMQENEIHSTRKLNTPEFNIEDEYTLKNFFEKNQEVII